MRKVLILISTILLVCNIAKAQEFFGKVTIRYDKIQGIDAKVFETLEASLMQLVNNTKWTEDNYKQFEKIECNFLLNLTKRSGNVFNGTLTIQASRPVFNATYTTPLVNYLDKDVSFKYEQGQLVIFDQQRVSGADPLAANLPALFAYYLNIILGLNYDSFKQGGGTEYFKKSQYIVLNAPEEGKEIVGWKSNDGNNRNRFWLIDQFLNPRFSNFRPYFYVYHRFGLDQMAEKPEEARNAVFEGLTNLQSINKENPASILMSFFFNAKSAELINILKSAPTVQKKQYAAILAEIDIPNANKYNDAAK